jgi:hypothetical protein
MKITQKLPRPTGVAASGSVVGVLPIGLSYETLFLVYAGTLSVSMMSNIRIVANGKPIQEYRTGTELDTLNQYNKRTASATNSILMIDFNRRLLLRQDYRELTKLGTGMPVDLRQTVGKAANGADIPNPNYNPFPVQTLTVEMDLSSSVGATGTLSLYALQSQPAPTGLLRKVRKFTHNPTATPFDIADYPKGDMINAIYLLSTTGGTTGVKITNVKLLRENYTVFDRTRVLNNIIQTDGGIRTPQTGVFVLDTTEEELGDQVITTAGVNDLRLTIDFSTTPTVLASTVDFIGQLDR